MKRERELLARELNLSRSEREASINESSALSSKLSKARDDWQQSAEETFVRMRNNKASTTTWLQMLQEKQAGIEAQIAEINEREANLEQRRADLQNILDAAEERFQYMATTMDERGLLDAAAKGAAGRVDAQVNQLIRAEVERQVRVALQNPNPPKSAT